MLESRDSVRSLGVLSKEEIDNEIVSIGVTLEALEAEEADPTKCVEITAHFDVLRDPYRRAPSSLHERVSNLTVLRKRFEQVLSDRLPLIVDRYTEVNEQIHRSREEKEFWRDFLIRKAETSRQEHHEISG